MPHIAHQKLANQQALAGISSDMSGSNNALCQTVQHSFQKLHAGIGPNNLLHQADTRTLEEFCFSSPRSTFFIWDIQDVVHEEISPVLEEIKKLSTWPDGWDSYDALAPKHEAIGYAIQWIEEFYRHILDLPLDWIEPKVTANGEGDVCLEWRYGRKNLTIYIGNQSAEYGKEWRYGRKNLTIYIGNQSAEYGKDWDTDIALEMEDGSADSPDIHRDLWKWLMS